MAISVFFLSIQSVYTQNSRIDSLDRPISKATTDTGRINLVNKKISILAKSILTRL